MVESSLLEKEQSEIREQQKLQEIDRLKRVLSKVISDAGEKARQEVNHIREELNTSISKMAAEIQSLEMESGKKQVQLEKMIRENRTLQQELANANQGNPSEAERYTHALYQMKGKLRSAERTKNDALTRESQVRRRLEELEQRVEEQKKMLLESEERARALSQQYETECDKLRKEKIELLHELENMRGQLKSSELAKALMDEKMERELSTIARARSMQESEATQRLEAVEKSYRSKVHHLQQDLLSAQRKNLKSVTNHFSLHLMAIPPCTYPIT
jgi:chromosome segregation ATPase